MPGKIYKAAYNELRGEQVALLSIIMAFVENDGLVNICDGAIIEKLDTTKKRFISTSNFLLSQQDISRWCSASNVRRTTWYSDFDCLPFFTGRFYIIWDSKRLNQNEWSTLRELVFKRDNYTCQYCGTRGGKLECDHKHPISKGGSNDIDNLNTSCFDCNREKRDKTIQEWLC